MLLYIIININLLININSIHSLLILIYWLALSFAQLALLTTEVKALLIPYSFSHVEREPDWWVRHLDYLSG